MRVSSWRTVQQSTLLPFSSSSSSSSSRLWRTPFCAGFPAMAGRASYGFSSDDSSRQTSDFAGSHKNPMHDSSETLKQSNGAQALHIDAENTEKPGFSHADHETLLQSNCSLSPKNEKTKEASTEERSGHVRSAKEGREVLKFQLKNSCVLALQRGDITKWSVDGQTDAIVNAANTRMLGGGGVDGAIHRAAGPDLYEACLKLPLVGKQIRCRTGDAVITKGFWLPVSKIVHTAGPVYVDDESSGPLLESSYKSSLLLAVNNGINYLAFPAISCGIYGYPYGEAAEIALNTVNENSAGLKEVHFVLFEEGSWVQWLSKASRSFEKVE